jgi:hypothetical protein
VPVLQLVLATVEPAAVQEIAVLEHEAVASDAEEAEPAVRVAESDVNAPAGAVANPEPGLGRLGREESAQNFVKTARLSMIGPPGTGIRAGYHPLTKTGLIGGKCAVSALAAGGLRQ